MAAAAGGAGQIVMILEQVERVLAAASSSKNSILKVQVFLRDVARGFPVFRNIWNEWMENCFPPVSNSGASLLRSPAQEGGRKIALARRMCSA